MKGHLEGYKWRQASQRQNTETETRSRRGVKANTLSFGQKVKLELLHVMDPTYFVFNSLDIFLLFSVIIIGKGL